MWKVTYINRHIQWSSTSDMILAYLLVLVSSSYGKYQEWPDVPLPPGFPFPLPVSCRPTVCQALYEMIFSKAMRNNTLRTFANRIQIFFKYKLTSDVFKNNFLVHLKFNEKWSLSCIPLWSEVYNKSNAYYWTRFAETVLLCNSSEFGEIYNKHNI